MEKIRLGQSDLMVSRLCLGCMGLGDAGKGPHRWTVGLDESRQILHRALEKGINFFDTAAAYQSGTSEQYVGKILGQLIPRQDVVVATKFLPRSQKEIAAGVSGQEHIAQSLDRSLQHLGMDYVDLMILHMWDYHTPLSDIMEGLHRQVQAGKVRAVGISNCFAWQLMKANALAKKEGFTPFVSIQGHYNLLFREEEREMVPLCREEHIALTPYSALAGGRLARPVGQSTERLRLDAYAREKYSPCAAQDAEIIRRVEKIANEKSVSMTQVALRWLLSKTDSPVVGATRPEQVDGMVAALSVHLTEEDSRFLEEAYTPHPLVGVMAENTP